MGEAGGLVCSLLLGRSRGRGEALVPGPWSLVPGPWSLVPGAEEGEVVLVGGRHPSPPGGAVPQTRLG